MVLGTIALFVAAYWLFMFDKSEMCKERGGVFVRTLFGVQCIWSAPHTSKTGAEQ